MTRPWIDIHKAWWSFYIDTDMLDLQIDMLQICLFFRRAKWEWEWFNRPYSDVPWWYFAAGPLFIAWD